MQKKKTSSSTYHHGDLSNELKKKALAFIKKHGLEKLNLRELADQCHVSATAVYRHYDSKEHLLAVLAEEGFHVLQNAMQQTEEGVHRLQYMGLAYIQFALRDPIRFRLMIDPSIDKKKYPDLLKAQQQTYEIVKAVVKKNLQDGIMTGDINILTSTAWVTVHGTVMLFLGNQLPVHADEEANIKLAYEITSVVGRGLMRTD